jgi:hypothetical protein
MSAAPSRAGHWAEFLLAAVLVSLALAVPFLKVSHQTRGPFTLEVWMSSRQAGRVQVYYDPGNLYRESESSTAALQPGVGMRRYSLPLPEGRFTTLRFDPIDRDGSVTIGRMRITGPLGDTIREIEQGDLRPINEISSLRRTGSALEVETTPGANDPQLLVTLTPAIVLRVSGVVAAEDWALRAAPMLAAILLVLGAARAAGPSRVRGAIRRLWSRPRAALGVISLGAVVASAYPVVFLGQSYVSPNLGTLLLYDHYPTLPGPGSAGEVDNHGSDVGAITWQFVPYAAAQHRALFAEGEIPLWNRWNSSGSALVAQGFSMLADPLHLLPVAADSAAWAWDLRFLISKWLFALVAGLIVLEATGCLGAAALVTLAAPFLGFFVYRVNHPAVFSFCYAPLPLYCWMRLARAGSSRSLVGWGAGLLLSDIALTNSGTVKEAYMLLLTLNLAGALVAASAARPWRERLATLGAGFSATVLLALVTAPLWRPFLEALSYCYSGYNAPSAFQVQPGVILGAFDEAFYRPLSEGGRVFNPAANFLILAGLLYFLATLRRHLGNRTIVALAVVTLVPLALAFGLVPPGWIVAVPFLRNVAHIDNSFGCGLIILCLPLAGAGFAAARDRLGTHEGRTDLAVAALLLFALVFHYIAFGHAAHRAVYGAGTTFSVLRPGETLPVPAFVWAYLAALLGALAAAGLIARRMLATGRVTPIGVAGLVIAAGVLMWRQGIQPPTAGFENYTAQLGPRADFHARSEAVDFVVGTQGEGPSRTVGIGNNLVPGWNGIHCLEGISGPDPLMNPYYRELTGAGPLPRLWDWRLYVNDDALGADRPFLDFLNVRHYLAASGHGFASTGGLQRVLRADLDVYESPTAWPRAFFADGLAVYSTPADLMGRILGGDGRPFAAVEKTELRLEPGLAALVGAGKGLVVPAVDYRLTEGTTAFTVHSPGPGVVVIGEAWWPGYPHARIDGTEAGVFRVNHAFEGILVKSAGSHRISVSYRPRGFNRYLAEAAAGLALVGILAAVAVLPRRRKP